MSWEPELLIKVPAITICESAFSNVPAHPTQHKSRVDSCNRNEERFSKTSSGGGIPESRERDPESQQNSCSVQERIKAFESLDPKPQKQPASIQDGKERLPFVPPAFSSVPAHPTQHKSRVDSCDRNEERFSKTSNGEGIQESQERDPESQHQFSIVQERRKNFESPALSHGPTKPPKMESGVDSHKSVQERFSKQSKGNADPVILERDLSHGPKKPPKMESGVDSHRRLQERFSKQSKGNADPVILERGRSMELITSVAMESMREEMEKILSEKLAVLQRQLEMTQQAIPPMKEMTNTWASLQKLPENMQALQEGLENLRVSTKEDLQMLRVELKGFFIEQCYKVDVTLNADTAHPRLEVSEDGKSVTDTGVIRQVPSKEERFDSHTFVLAKEGYTSGRQYWEVDVGRRRNWILGVASESVARKGTMTLSPKNGFWVIGLADGEEYWAHTDPWTRLTMSGRPEKIGIFLNISANKLSFYNARKKTALYTFTSIGGSKQERKFIPFFSTGSSGSVHDTEPLKIVQEFDDDD